MKPVWVIVADSSQARIFSAENSQADLIEIETLLHPEGRLHDRDMESDLPGKTSGPQGAGGHAYSDEHSPKEQEEINFATRVAHHLSDELNQNKYDRLFMVAAPSFLGDLRNALSSRVEKHIAFSLGKNIVKLSPEEIRSHLPLSLAS
jgi:protein required for attachment to host cells